MGSSLYTRAGDGGTTSLADGTRLSKTAPRVDAYGTVDEANSWVGAARASLSGPASGEGADRQDARAFLDRALEFLQHRLYNCSSNLATPSVSSRTAPRIAPEDVAWLEAAIDRFELSTGAIDRFIVPGGTAAAGFLHVARTVVRRAERILVGLAMLEPVDTEVCRFVNRASDFLFAAARYANWLAGCPDIAWQRRLSRPNI